MQKPAGAGRRLHTPGDESVAAAGRTGPSAPAVHTDWGRQFPEAALQALGDLGARGAGCRALTRCSRQSGRVPSTQPLPSRCDLGHSFPHPACSLLEPEWLESG